MAKFSALRVRGGRLHIGYRGKGHLLSVDSARRDLFVRRSKQRVGQLAGRSPDRVKAGVMAQRFRQLATQPRTRYVVVPDPDSEPGALVEDIFSPNSPSLGDDDDDDDDFVQRRLSSGAFSPQVTTLTRCCVCPSCSRTFCLVFEEAKSHTFASLVILSTSPRASGFCQRPPRRRPALHIRQSSALPRLRQLHPAPSQRPLMCCAPIHWWLFLLPSTGC